jgi:glycosyltransferase involved in cell wall biosynthesis
MSQLISVLMPAKNAEKTIAKSVNSVLFQLQRNDELLVLDDQSQDATLKILKSIPDSRLRVIEAQKSLGVAEATNALLSNAKFELVARLDADDYALSGRFDFQREVMTRFQNLTLTFMSAVNFGVRPKYFFPINLKGISSAQFPWRLLLGNPVVNSTSMFRKSIIQEMGGFRQSPAEDYDLWLRCADRGYKLMKEGKVGSGYRKHDSQLTRLAEWKVSLKSDEFLKSSHTALATTLGWRFGSIWETLHKELPNPDEKELRLKFADFVKIGLSDASGHKGF